MTSSKDLLLEIASGVDAMGILQDICGVNEVNESGNEFIHSCKLPFGLHKNGDQSPIRAIRCTRERPGHIQEKIQGRYPGGIRESRRWNVTARIALIRSK